MKQIILFLSFITLMFLISSALINNSADLSVSQTEPIDLIAPPQFKINSTIPINIVFIGFDESNIDTNQIDSDITHWYAPIISQWDYPYFGSNYTLDMSYYFSNATTLENDYINYLSTIFTTTTTLPASLSDYDSGATQALLFPADLAISWLNDNINSYFSGVNNSYTMYFIDTYTWGYIFDYYFYTLDYLDPDTGQPTLNPYTIMYGGDYPNRGIFMDLSAGPVNYNEEEITEASEGVSSTTIPPIWEYNLPTDKIKLNTNVTEYIQETIDMVFTTSYLYDPVVRDNFDVDIVLFDDATTSQSNQIDTNVIENAFSFLFPTSNVDISLTIDTMTNNAALATEFTNSIDPEDNTIVNGESIVSYLLSNLNTFGMTENTIPVFIWAWDDDLWLGGSNTLGYAADDGFGNPAMVVMGYNPTMGNPNEGYTITIVHEIGHMLGLRHPHDGVSFDGYLETGDIDVFDWLRDFISTPMTYAQVDSSFSTFDIDNMDRAYTYERINDTWWNLFNANYSLVVEKGYDNFSQIDITSDLNQYLDWTLTNKTLSLASFENEEFFDAFVYANFSSFASELYSNEVAVLSNYVTPTSTTSSTITTTSDITSTFGDTSSSQPTTSDTTSTKTESNEDSSPLSNLVIISGIIILAFRRKLKSNQGVS